MNYSLAEKEKAKERIFEAIFEYAGSCHVENIAEQMEEENQLDEQICFPEELDARMRELINSYSKKINRKKASITFRKSLPKVAAFLIILLSTMTIFTMSVEAIRIRLLNFITDETKQYTNIEVKEEESLEIENSLAVIPPDWEGLYAPTYMPEGFMINKANSFPNINIIVYSNDTGQTIIFEKRLNEKIDLRIDAEDANTEQIMINNCQGLIVRKGKESAIVWHNDDISFTLKGQIDKNELIKIAESVKIAK